MAGAVALQSGYARIPRAGLAVAGLSVALHLAALAVADAWVRPAGHSWERATPLRDAVQITLAPVAKADADTLRTLDAALDATASLVRDVSSLSFAASAPVEPVALDAPPIPTPLDAVLDAPKLPEPGDAYHRLADLTKRPVLLTPVELLVNGTAAAQRPGRMRIRLLISPHGRIDEVVIDNSSLAAVLRDEVVARFANAVYEPGEIDGKPVPSQVTIEIRS
jgi:Gram-negative bacterial TonB protein C-terminal